MVVQHNLQAMNANRMLGITTKSQSKATEKLSSGYRINRAADDAAGLSISEKMRKQIKGLDQASTNAQDGISAVQTAEGALTEVHAMLQRMNELAVQAANGTNAESDRQSIQNEIEQLTTEIDRVAETTKFNESYLLKGNGKETSINIAAKDAGIAGELTGVSTGLATFKMEALETGEQITIGSKGYTIGTGITTVRAEVEGLVAGDKMSINGTEYKVVDDGETDPANKAYTAAELASMVSDADKVVIGSNTYVAMVDGSDLATYQATDDVKDAIADLADGKKVKIDGVEYTVGTGTAAAPVTTDKAADIAALLEDGFAYTIDGTEKTGATANLTDQQTEIEEALAAGKEVTIKGIKFTADENSTNTASLGTLQGTADTIADLVTDGAKVTVDTASADAAEVVAGEPADPTVVPDGVGDNDASIISKEEAYKLIGEELLKASSVGCDPGADAAAAEEDPISYLDENGNVTENIDEAVTVRYNIKEATVMAKQGLQFTLHVGADADESNKIALTIEAMDAAGLGIKNMNVVDNTGAKATYAIDSIADAIQKVSAQRSELGAIQNRLEHTIANLDNVVENTTAAESAIRDTDMAEQMVEFSKNNILMQAGQSMLAQANQSTQGVLSLLQ